ncbi:hypothetical protein M5K25_019742 [Dendrobium thyrsiflorum]|uniref:Uncharacterized protein n=1 Tax=Dendrobium thyrsiflorum TaxID=117978 RepID=A0ABD0UG18_DENTH
MSYCSRHWQQGKGKFKKAIGHANEYDTALRSTSKILVLKTIGFLALASIYYLPHSSILQQALETVEGQPLISLARNMGIFAMYAEKVGTPLERTKGQLSVGSSRIHYGANSERFIRTLEMKIKWESYAIHHNGVNKSLEDGLECSRSLAGGQFQVSQVNEAELRCVKIMASLESN